MDDALIDQAAGFAELHLLRAYDAVHLASAKLVEAEVGALHFACWDAELQLAARVEGLRVLPEDRSQ